MESSPNGKGTLYPAQIKSGRLGLLAATMDTTASLHDPWIMGLRFWYLLLIDVTSQSFMDQCLRARYIAFCDLPPLVVLDSIDKLCDAHLLVIARKTQPSFLRDVLRLVPDQCAGFIHVLERAIGRISNTDTSAVRSWRQILTFLLRPNFGLDVNSSESFVDEWESRNSGSFTDVRTDLGSMFYSITRPFFERNVACFGYGTHGPGASAYRTRRGDIVTSRLTINQKDHYLEANPNFWIGLPDEIPTVPEHDFPLRTNVLKLVPKSWKKLRLICIEPVSLQYHQHFIMHGLYCAIEIDDFWRSHVDFSHVERVIPLIRSGSISGDYATIDLSAASDSVSVSHMRGLLMHTDFSYLLHMMETSRSISTLLPNGRCVEANLAATMGNGFCFPLETLVFGTLCAIAIDKCGDDVTHSRFRVYGDDIIIEERFVEALLSTLGEFGFSVNESKSFTGDSPFRESCGFEFYHGIDITPLRLPRTLKGIDVIDGSLDAMYSLVDISNQCFDRFPLLRREIVHSLIRDGHWAIPFSVDGLRGIRSRFPNNDHLVGGYSEDLQRDIRLYPQLQCKTEVRKRQSLALYEWLGSANAHPNRTIGVSEGSRVAARGSFKTINWF